MEFFAIINGVQGPTRADVLMAHREIYEMNLIMKSETNNPFKQIFLESLNFKFPFQFIK